MQGTSSIPDIVSSTSYNLPKTLGTEKVQCVGNFDVLLGSDSAGRLDLLRDRQHVGNNRFQVLLTMNARQYEENSKSGKETDPVVERIIDIVCRQVVPNGRFLLKNPADWTVLNREMSKLFVTGQLNNAIDSRTPTPTIKSILAPAAEATSSLPEHDDVETSVSPSINVPSNVNLSASITIPSSFGGSIGSSMGGAPVNTRSSMPNMASLPADTDTVHEDEEFLRALEPVPLGKNITIMDNDGEKKRRRRSSLLRRSASESLLLSATSFNDEPLGLDKKKSFRKYSNMDQNLFSAASFVASLEAEQEELETQDPFVDDLMERSQGIVSPMRSRQKQGRRGLLAGLLKRSDSFETKRSNIVTRAEPLDVIFQDPVRRAPNSSVFSLQQHTGNNRLNVFMNMQMERYRSSSVMERKTIALELRETVQKHWGGQFLKETSDSGYEIVSDDDAVGFLLQAFNERLKPEPTPPAASKGPTPTSLPSIKMPAEVSGNDVQLRNRAVESLQKRKKRIGLASRIRTFAETTRTALTRSLSEPARNFNSDRPESTQAPIPSATYSSTPSAVASNLTVTRRHESMPSASVANQNEQQRLSRLMFSNMYMNDSRTHMGQNGATR